MVVATIHREKDSILTYEPSFIFVKICNLVCQISQSVNKFLHSNYFTYSSIFLALLAHDFHNFILRNKFPYLSLHGFESFQRKEGFLIICLLICSLYREVELSQIIDYFFWVLDKAQFRFFLLIGSSSTRFFRLIDLVWIFIRMC